MCMKNKLHQSEHLTLINIPVELDSLYPIVPALRTLNADIQIYDCIDKCHLYPPENLERLSLEVHRIHFSTIKASLRQMTKLAYLTIIAYGAYHDMGDGAAWEQILTKIISFKFSFIFDKSTWIEEPIKLDSFRSLFWLETKQWYVGYDRCTVSGFSLLYSIPYFMDTYPWYNIKGTINTELTGPQMLSINNVERLFVNEQSPADYKCLRRFLNLKKLAIAESDKTFHLLFHNIIPHIDISKITTLIISENRSNIDINSFIRLISSMPHLHSLNVSIIFIKSLFFSHWPNIRRLEILLSAGTATLTERSLTLNETERFYRSFTNIEYLSFYQGPNSNLSILLNKIPKTISNVVIHHSVNRIPAEIPNFITRDWIEENTQLRHFSYLCNKLNNVSLWF